MSDFEIEISGEGSGGYRITARSTAAGEASAGPVAFPLDEQALERALAAFERALLRSAARYRRMSSETEQPARELGQKLFDFVLPSNVRANWLAARHQASVQGEQLRMRLRIGPPELLPLPWEILYDASRDEYLSFSTPVTRSLDVSEPVRPMTVALPLQILAMAALPAGHAELDVQRERELLGEALAPLEQQGRVRVTWVEGQTWWALQAALDRGDWHVLHFVGHGGFDPRSGEGIIALANDEGMPDELSASDLGTMLAGKSSLRLVVLNSCDGARGNATDRFSSTASVLLRRGIPAVVAMQYEISDDAAKAFARGFYTALAARHPIERAVTRARLAVKRGSKDSLEWATPVMYLRSTAGELFDIAGVAAPDVPAPAPSGESIEASDRPADGADADRDDGEPTDTIKSRPLGAITTSTGPAPPQSPPPWRARLLHRVAVVAVVALIGGVVAVVRIATDPGAGPPPSPSASPSVSRTTSATSGAPTPSGALFADDFSGPSLDPGKWRTPQYPDNTYQRDGHLVLAVRPAKEVDYGRLQTQPLARPFTDVTFTVTVLPFQHGGDGGGSFVINGAGSQPQILSMGPSAQGGVYVDPLTCDKLSCQIGKYDDFTQPEYKAPPMALGEAIPVEIARTDGHLVFSAKGVELGRTKIDPGPLGEFWFAVSSGGVDSWDVQIDNLVVR